MILISSNYAAHVYLQSPQLLTQVPPFNEQHTWPSVQVLVYTQPIPATQASSVHLLLSLQTPGQRGPGTHSPFEHRSGVVQAIPSHSLFWLRGVCWQPPFLSQLSVVQTFWSLQSNVVVPDLHTLLAQTSPVVHALPSSQGAVLAVFTQPVL
jgi:hypothetical protein